VGRFGWLVVIAGLSSCGFIPKNIDAYEGPRQAGSKLALIRQPNFSNAWFDSISRNGSVIWRDEGGVERPQVSLEPGTYEVVYRCTWESSYGFLSTGNGHYEHKRSDILELIAGHSYSIHGDIKCNSNSDLWIEEDSSGEVVAGVRS
jgi:hypothetical protein